MLYGVVGFVLLSEPNGRMLLRVISWIKQMRTSKCLAVLVGKRWYQPSSQVYLSYGVVLWTLRGSVVGVLEGFLWFSELKEQVPRRFHVPQSTF